MRDGRGELIVGGLDAEELDQIANDFFRVRGQLGKLDAENGNLWMFCNELIAMLEQAPLQTFTRFVVGGEPLIRVLVRAILQAPNRRFDVTVDGNDAE